VFAVPGQPVVALEILELAEIRLAKIEIAIRKIAITLSVIPQHFQS
jgi:hypothetical protein